MSDQETINKLSKIFKMEHIVFKDKNAMEGFFEGMTWGRKNPYPEKVWDVDFLPDEEPDADRTLIVYYQKQ